MNYGAGDSDAKYRVIFHGSNDGRSRSLLNARLWFSQKLLSSLVPHQKYFLHVCWFGKEMRLDVKP